MSNNDAIIIGDTHMPYAHKEAMEWAIQVITQKKPCYVVQIGDLYDFYAFSRYAKSMKIDPFIEVRQGREMAEKFWSKVHKVSPRSKCYQVLGNHDDRPFKRLLDKAPELEPFFNDRPLFEFKGVITAQSSRDEIILNICGRKTSFMHGHYSKLGDHMVFNGMDTVVGHTHRGGVFFKRYRDDVYSELNCGYLADPDSGPMQYGPQRRKHSTLGLGHIDHCGPRFIPFKEK